MNNYKKNKKLLQENHSYSPSMEHDACGVGMIAATNGKKSRKIVEYGIEALKAIWHRGAVDADGKSGDGAGIQIEIAPDFFKKKFWLRDILLTIRREFVWAWCFFQEQITQIKKNVEK